MKLLSWGANSYGQLGHGVASNECLIPSEVAFKSSDCQLEDIVSIIGGGGHTLLLSKEGSLHGCGLNSMGQLGKSPREIHVLKHLENDDSLQFTQVSSKWDSCYGLNDTGHCFGWGSNSFGQLGHPPEAMAKSEIPVNLLPLRCKQIAAGLRHCAVLTENGIIMTAGDPRKGQLGRPLSQMAHIFQPVRGISRVKCISLGQQHSLALTEDNKLYAWGCNKFGQLGVDPTLHQIVLFPLEIPVPEGYIDNDAVIHSGWTHSAVLNGNGTVINWGRNKYGQLGSSSYERRVEWKPEPLKIERKISKLYIGSEHNLAILDDGVLVSWGWNEHGSCGIGNTIDVMKPVCVEVRRKVALAGAGSGHSFAILES